MDYDATDFSPNNQRENTKTRDTKSNRKPTNLYSSSSKDIMLYSKDRQTSENFKSLNTRSKDALSPKSSNTT